MIRVLKADICGTDLEIAAGYKGFRGILGHEFAGEVVACSDESWLGKRVCGEINVWCGHCAMCLAGLTSHCQNRTILGISGRSGAFAEYLALPVRNLHPVPDAVDDDEAVFVEPLAAAFQILEQVEIRAGDKVAVLGDGRLGILCARALASAGHRIVCVGKHAEKRARVQSEGIHTTLLSEALPGSFDIVVEASGSPTGFDAAIDLLRPRGKLILKSTLAHPARVNLSKVVVNEIQVIGSRCGPFPRAIEALETQWVQVRDLIDARFPLDQAVSAMQKASESGILKVVLDITK
ncbi:MAG: MDR/zinc-dependent alcohol dehydrogenase-like family protein [Chloroflexota bacterium]